MKLIMENWRGFVKEDQDEAEEVEELEPATADEGPEEDAAYPPWVQDYMKIPSAQDLPDHWGPSRRLQTGEGEWKVKHAPQVDENPWVSTGDARGSIHHQDGHRRYPVLTYPGEEAPGWIQYNLDKLLWVPPVGHAVEHDTGNLYVHGSDVYASKLSRGEPSGSGATTAAEIAEWLHKQELKKAAKLRKIIELGGGLEKFIARAEKVRREFRGMSRDNKAYEHFAAALGQTKTFVMDKLLGGDE